MEIGKVEQEVKLTFDELVVLSGLVVGHRINMAPSAANNHWQVLQKLHEKLCLSLAECVVKIKELDSKEGLNGSK